MERYSTVEREAEAEFVEKRSRFIGYIRPVTTEQEALDFLAAKRKEHWDASHNCYAYLIRAGNIQRYSDDGEPQGTAGVPILEVLRREGLTDVIVVVTRYFGGTLLGAGGLVRAYSHGAKLAVDATPRAEMCLCAVFELLVPYPLYERVNLLLRENQAVVLDTGFEADVQIRGQIPTDRMEALQQQLTEASSGTVCAKVLGEEFGRVPV